MTLPANRTKLQAAITNQQPSIIASAQANREAMVEAYDTIDQLYNFTSGFVAGGTLQPYPFGVNRNALINPGFNVNTRTVSGTVTLTAGQYGHDRWKAGAAGCTYTFATVNNVTTITITAGSLVQVIEGINLYGGTYTLTWTGTAQGKIGAGSYGATGITGAAVGGTNLSIEFNAGTISQVQLNFGSGAVPFQPRIFAEELALCKRYCYLLTAVGGNNGFVKFGLGQVFSATQAAIPIHIPEMRIAPTVTTAAAALFFLSDATFAANKAVSTIVASAKTNKLVELTVTSATGLTAGNATNLLANNNNTAFILFDAEI